ncbi:LysE family translocator [Corallococcus macrosporus]|uniref:LysE family translocator n=1 Tax=Corallococcus macrosporus TaxID=35 RepID=A0ABS3DPG8_9BACT|nr:LysE family translocator [Corallococcus macrosporus]MBN8233224.1 LysE family translocator [Corallococcus macrosporus]
MTVTQSLLAFVVAAFILAITPGIDTAMVLRTSALEGPRRAGFAAVGICLGCLVWGGAVALGLGALLAASQVAYTVLSWAGAAYLVWLGIGLLWKPRSRFVAEEAAPHAEVHRGATAWLRRGLLTNVLNPKVGVFYVTFLPQFVPQGVPVMAYTFLLAVIHAVAGAVWFALLIGVTAPLGRILRRPAFMKTMDRLTGCVFIAFGAKLALSRR